MRAWLSRLERAVGENASSCPDTCDNFGEETRIRKAAFVAMSSVTETCAPGMKAENDAGAPRDVTTVAPVTITLVVGADRLVPSTKVRVFPRRETTVPDSRWVVFSRLVGVAEATPLTRRDDPTRRTTMGLKRRDVMGTILDAAEPQ